MPTRHPAVRTTTATPPHAHPPAVRLGAVQHGGLAPAILAIIERGVRHRPALAHTLGAEIELAIEEPYPPVRIAFGERRVLVEDGPGSAPDLRISGSLADLVSLMVVPLVRGVPSPIRGRGRAAFGLVAQGRVKVEGRLGLMRKFLLLIRV
jgi:hypothetical protein